MAWLSAATVAVSSESQGRADVASCIEGLIADEVESVSEFIQEFSEVTTRRAAWTESPQPREEAVGPWWYVRWILDTAFAKAFLPWFFLHSALQASVIFAWCGMLVLLSSQPLAYRIVYWCSIFVVKVMLFRQVDLSAWGQSPPTWLCLFVLLSLLFGTWRGYSEYVSFSEAADDTASGLQEFPLTFSFVLLYPIARLVAACFHSNRRIGIRACWQLLGTLLGAIPFLAAKKGFAATFTGILEVPFVASVSIALWSLLGIPLRAIGKRCWRRLSAKQSLLLTILWVSYVELAISGLSLVVWARKPVWALGHALAFAMVVVINLIRGRICLQTMSPSRALMQRMSLHFEVFAAMLACSFRSS
eukprot:TRINITY_DN27491_c0_g1_i9.p1 TRINITY_DN27491_c0_g1~~TRINITY_DN27491_c0_g1_i9.p1  ORF type:complete len:361 (-),score=-5.22 TRINITY_DN27491_c0_g1_i9:791-1873(-)